MKRHQLLFIGLFFSLNLFAQEDKIDELVLEGIELHDAKKYEEAIGKYNAALKINNRSSIANYELSYTYMISGKYHDAIKYSKTVIKQNGEHLEAAYVVYGSSLDLTGKPKEAMKVYEEALNQFPESYLLHYNLAVTAFNVKDFVTAEQSAIKALQSNPRHSSSHLVLANTMVTKGDRVKGLLALYNFLVLEPVSQRSLPNYKLLQKLMNQGVAKTSENNINISVPSLSGKDNEFGAAEMTLSLLWASKFSTNKDKSEFEVFNETTRSFFALLGELKKNNKGFWWDFYVTRFQNLLNDNHQEAFAYYISQCTQSAEVNDWLQVNSDKVLLLKEWIGK